MPVQASLHDSRALVRTVQITLGALLGTQLYFPNLPSTAPTAYHTSQQHL